MVDVSDKADTRRLARARGRIVMAPETLALAIAGEAKKGDVFGVARLAGIMAAKKNQRSDPAMSSAATVQRERRHHAGRQSAGRDRHR